MKKALITGITGQDGSYLTELLASKGYDVHGVVRRKAGDIRGNLNKAQFDIVTLHYGDLTDGASLHKILNSVAPDEVYNLGAQSDVAISFENPILTTEINAVGTLKLLESMRQLKLPAKFYQAGTSEMFGKFENKLTNSNMMSESTPFHPQSPYGCSKVFAYNITKNYREAYDMFACNGILFNHESPRRGEKFVTQKIVTGLVKVFKNNDKQPVELGNLDSVRDWGHAKDYVDGMWKILQHSQPDDFILATGRATTVREFVELVVQYLFQESIIWKGEGVREYGYLPSTGTLTPIIVINPKYYRPSDVTYLRGSHYKALQKLNWSPTISLKELVEDMVESKLHEV